MRTGVCIVICASMLAAVLDAVGVRVTTFASKRAAVVDGCARVYYQLCQSACSGRGCARACIVSLVRLSLVCKVSKYPKKTKT